MSTVIGHRTMTGSQLSGVGLRYTDIWGGIEEKQLKSLKELKS